MYLCEYFESVCCNIAQVVSNNMNGYFRTLHWLHSMYHVVNRDRGKWVVGHLENIWQMTMKYMAPSRFCTPECTDVRMRVEWWW